MSACSERATLVSSDDEIGQPQRPAGTSDVRMRTMNVVMTDPCATERRDTLVERLFESAIGMLDVMSVYVGDRLGLYQVLAERGSLTSGQLAAATGTNERY